MASPFATDPADAGVPSPDDVRRPRGARFGDAWLTGRTGGLLVSAALLFTVLTVVSDSFLSPYTMSVLSRQVAFYVLIALAQSVCLIVGGMNLSVGAIGGISTVVLGLCLQSAGLPGWLGVIVALAVGSLAGLVNGLLITKMRIDSFIVTLSMMFVYMGLRSGLSGGNPYRVPDSLTWVGQGETLGVPYLFVLACGVLAAAAFVFRSTIFGRHLLATGGNIDAARLSGVNTNAMILAANTLSGVLSALAAVLWASKLGSAAPETGDNWLVASFAVAIIGGTGLAGGVFSAAGLLLGGVVFMLIKHSLVELRANDYYANAFLGGLILLAIIVDRVRESVEGRQR